MSITWPAAATVHDPSSGSSSAMCRAKAPNRIRSGDDVGTPLRINGWEVTGPTHIACTSVRSASSSWSSMARSRLRSSTAAAAGADVKLTASNCRRAIPVTSWSNSPPNGVDFHRYTRMGTTSAPAERNPPMNSGNGSQASAAPCSWMAIAHAGHARFEQILQHLL